MSLESHFQDLHTTLQKTELQHQQTIKKIAAEIVTAFKSGNKIIVCGNGGSYVDACHFAGELESAYKNRNRKPLPALVPANPAALTATANDFGYQDVFKKFVEAVVHPGDIVIGLSTSGNSPNVVRALQAGRLHQAKTIAFTGSGGGDMKQHADILLDIPATDTARIQEVQHFAYHEICELVETALFPTEKK